VNSPPLGAIEDIPVDTPLLAAGQFIMMENKIGFGLLATKI